MLFVWLNVINQHEPKVKKGTCRLSLFLSSLHILTDPLYIYLFLWVVGRRERLRTSPAIIYHLFSCVDQNAEAKSLREASLEAPRRGAEVKDDDPIIPFGPQPTVSRFGAISRTSKTGYQTTGPVQAMASSPQNPSSKHMAMPGKKPCLKQHINLETY